MGTIQFTCERCMLNKSFWMLDKSLNRLFGSVVTGTYRYWLQGRINKQKQKAGGDFVHQGALTSLLFQTVNILIDTYNLYPTK